MSSYNLNYSFNISGNCTAVIQEVTQNMVILQNKVEETQSVFSKFGDFIIKFNQISQWASSLSSALGSTLAPGAELNYKLAELSAIAGPTAEELALVEKSARETAKEFGISAAGAVESYKLLLSQLSPELTKNSEALNHMGKNVATLSKMMGNDATAAAEVLTTAMNQYGVSMDDPIAASDKMSEMMNTMSAAARVGSAELPQIAEALKQCGMASKAANVPFEETNAAIQVLDKAGKKGSEGGVALRNVMSTLAQGRFLPKDVREELAGAGVSLSDLTDKSKSLAERLQVLKPVMQDDALFSKLFGKENSAAAMALVSGIPKIQEWTEAITGTTTAIDQSQIIMETYNERLARVHAKFDDFKISVFNCCGDLGIWIQVITSALVPLSQLVPLIYAAVNAVNTLKTIDFASSFSGVTKKIRDIIIGLTMMNTSIVTSGGYWVAFKLLAQGVCRSIGSAIMSIPIVGWIAAGITAVIVIIKRLWDKCYEFRVAIFTAWEAIKAIFSYTWELLSGLGQRIAEFFVGVWEAIKSMAQKVANVFMAIINKIRSWIDTVRSFVADIISKIVEKVSTFCAPLVEAFRGVTNSIKGFFIKIFDWISEKFVSFINWIIDKYNWLARKFNFAKIARLGKEAAAASWAADHPDGDNPDGETPSNVPSLLPGGGGDSPLSSALGGVGGSSSSSKDRIKNIYITIDKLIDKFSISTTNLSESKERIKDAVAEALLSAVNDANYAL
ncbi:MAG: phage tail tape measure protein [Bacteroidales bacterium]|nr:phage tail tape measure protein [Bacteroidales bacterium]